MLRLFARVPHDHVVMNFHILQKWLSEQRKIDYNNLNPLEQKIILYLANGYTPNEILNEKVMEGKTCDDDRLRTIIYDILPARCNVESVCQVMAIEDYDLEVHLVKEGSIISKNSKSHGKFIHGIKVLAANFFQEKGQQHQQVQLLFSLFLFVPLILLVPYQHTPQQFLPKSHFLQQNCRCMHTYHVCMPSFPPFMFCRL